MPAASYTTSRDTILERNGLADIGASAQCTECRRGLLQIDLWLAGNREGKAAKGNVTHIALFSSDIAWIF
jgi:hypothetical protein